MHTLTTVGKLDLYVKISSLTTIAAGILLVLAHMMGWSSIFLTTDTNGTTLQTSILVLFSAVIISLDRLLSSEIAHKIKFILSSIALVYLLQGLFDPSLPRSVDAFFANLTDLQYGIGTSINTKISIVFIMMSAATYSAGNKVLSLSTAYISWLFPLMLMYDSFFWGAQVLGGMSYQTGAALFLVGTSLFAKRIMYEPFIDQIRESIVDATVVRLTALGVVLSISSITVASQLNNDIDHIIPLLVACFIYQHVLFNSSTRMALDLKDSAVRNKLLYEQSITDSLTGVGNRGAVKDILKDYRKLGVRKVGVILFDLDFFKLVNDRHGHDVGDRVLIELCRYVEDRLRSSDVLVRWGGEEFLIIVPTANMEEVYNVAEMLRNDIRNTELAGMNVTLSAGVVTGDVTLFDNLVTKADKALYYSKQNGRNRVTVASKSFMDTGKVSGQFITIREIEEALQNDEMYFMYQPIVDNSTGKIMGIEALIRWDKNGETITAGVFAEKLNNVMLANPETNAAKFCELVKRSIRGLDGIHPDAYLSFNVNITQLYNPDAVDMLIDCMSAEDTVNRRIMIEILEAPGLPDMLDDVIIENLHRIRQAGIMLALDDFGVEDSNLVRLISLPIDIVKIDQKVTRMIAADNNLHVRTIQLLDGMYTTFTDMHVNDVIIEGVETDFQRKELSQLGLVHHQGYAYNKPLTLLELSKAYK